MREKLYKRCPRCNRKMHIYADRCDTCSLVFDRLKNVTNRAGKVALRNNEKNKVIYVKEPPKDINKWKLLAITFFLGIFGVHFFKVGRNKIGIFMCVSLFLFLFYGIGTFYGLIPSELLDDKFIGLILYLFMLPEAICSVIWLSSVVQVAFNSFKYPVSIDEEYVIDTPVAKEILENAKQERKKQKDAKKTQNNTKNS